MAPERMTPVRCTVTGASLIQRPMRSETVVIVSVGFQDPTQMRFATDDRDTRAGSIRSAVRQRHSARARRVQTVCPARPLIATGGGKRGPRAPPGPGSYKG